MKVVLTYGTFDLFHVGHVRLLKRLSEMGDRLIVGVSTDEFNNIKGKKSVFSYAERKEILSSCKYVDEVIPENSWDQKISDIKKYHVNIFSIGDDWEGKFDFLKDYCEVCYLKRTEDISSTDIKRSISSIREEGLNKLDETLKDIRNVLEAIRC
ncbi:glycerol-3-phosphate cytidylyltransferase [Vibrio vulnificus]|uniref:glycerol-3-phosphate cytidylyltransferase n=1 Tax=Vibrio vulnificus TaxID=672 RepID=UPI0028E282F6|nr:glycerol-3-phosphate cytidylyltransferase [Vibrio vulnificus]